MHVHPTLEVFKHIWKIFKTLSDKEAYFWRILTVISHLEFILLIHMLVNLNLLKIRALTQDPEFMP